MRCNFSKVFSRLYTQASFVRHAQTQNDVNNIIHGSSAPEMPLTQKGVIQAERLGRELGDIKYTKVFTSDYKRAYQTTEIILSQSSYLPSKITSDKRLREMSMGAIDGKRLPEFEERGIRHKAGFQNFLYSSPKGAESFHDMSSRVKSIFHDICEIADSETGKKSDCQEQNILCVTHAGFLLFLMEYLQTTQNLFQLNHFNDIIAYTMPQNASLTQLKIHPNRKKSKNLRVIEFESIYDTSHLDLME